MPSLEVVDGTVTFGSTRALDGVDLTVGDGELVAVLGPSGSGKSTLLRAVAGLQPLDSGAVRIAGEDVVDRPPHKRGVGMMFQDHALFPHHDVAANVGFGLRMQHRPAAEVAGRVAELLDLVGLPGFGDRSVRTLSGGEQQRVALARALAPAPGILLLDEPFGALDRPRRERLVAEVESLVRSLGLTVIAVTHDRGEAFALADRVAVMQEGRQLAVGAPASLWARPGSVAVARLLGIPNAGVIPAALGGGQGLVRAEGIHLDAGGPIAAVVRAAAFDGARIRVRAIVGSGEELELTAPVENAPAVGATIHLQVEPAAVQQLGP